MPTIQDAMDTCHRADLGIRIFGATYDWKRVYDAHVASLGKALLSDYEHNPNKIGLTPRSELGPEAQKAYDELRRFIKTTSKVSSSSLL